MKTNEEPIFDLIDHSEGLPKGFTYAYGFDLINFNSYYGLVEIDNNGLIGSAIAFLTIPNSLLADREPTKSLKGNFIDIISNELRQAI